jgi:hypothetical protein
MDAELWNAAVAASRPAGVGGIGNGGSGASASAAAAAAVSSTRPGLGAAVAGVIAALTALLVAHAHDSLAGEWGRLCLWAVYARC